MSPQLVIASLIVAGLATVRWLSRHRREHELESSAQIDDMFAYSMYDDPC